MVVTQGRGTGGSLTILHILINLQPCNISVRGLWSRVIGMSRHDRPPSWAWALFSVACMKEAKGQGWVRSHDNKLTGPLAKGMGDRVAGIQRWQGDGVGDRKLPGEGGEWRHVTNSPPIMFLLSFFLSVSFTILLYLSVHLSRLTSDLHLSHLNCHSHLTLTVQNMSGQWWREVVGGRGSGVVSVYLSTYFATFTPELFDPFQTEQS